MRTLFVGFMTASCAIVAQGGTTTFEDLTVPGAGYYNGSDNAGGFTSGGVFFKNSFTDFGGGFTSWDGFSYSNVNNTTTAGFTNQYAAYTGTGVGGSGNYAVAYYSSFNPTTNIINLPAGQTPQSAQITNTTYAALDMLSGSGFSKKFGGVSGDDLDYFSVTFTGYTSANLGGATTGSVTFFLADYQFANNVQDYIVDEWTALDLTPLGSAASIGFTFASSDVGTFGIKTPTYFALDNLVTVPEPASVSALAMGLIMLRRRRS